VLRVLLGSFPGYTVAVTLCEWVRERFDYQT
jgi:hypothetical protein